MPKLIVFDGRDHEAHHVSFIHFRRFEKKPPSLVPHQAIVRPSKIDDKENRSCPKMLTRQDARFSQSQTSGIEAPSPLTPGTPPDRNNPCCARQTDRRMW
jgi:hypothetical protein